MASLFMRILDIHFENREKGVAPLGQQIFKIHRNGEMSLGFIHKLQFLSPRICYYHDINK